MGHKTKPGKTQTEVKLLSLEEVREGQANGQPFQVCYGMGVDSTALLIGLHRVGIRPDAITFADVGGEKDATYSYLEVINEWLRSVDFPEVTVVKLPTAAETKRQRLPDPRTGEAYFDLEGQCYATGWMPSLAYQRHQCSIKWKGNAQERWAKKSWQAAQDAWGRGQTVIKAIGYDCGSADMKRGRFCAKHEPALYDYCYPLRWFGWAREDCQDIIRSEGLPVPPKSCCIFCPAMTAGELRELAHDEPHNLIRAIELEDHVKAVGKSELVGLWVRMGGKDRPTDTWREFAETEGLLELAERRMAERQAQDQKIAA